MTELTGRPTDRTATGRATAPGNRFRRLAAGALALAVLAGIAETVVVVAAVGREGGGGGLATQVAVRGLIYAAALACTWFLARGHRWAWWALLLGLGVLGLASMVVPMAAELVAGASWFAALGGGSAPSLPAIRVLHIVLVLVGVGLMLRREVRAVD